LKYTLLVTYDLANRMRAVRGKLDCGAGNGMMLRIIDRTTQTRIVTLRNHSECDRRQQEGGSGKQKQRARSFDSG